MRDSLVAAVKVTIMPNAAPLYELIYEGTTSQDEVSLRRLRTALVTEFELPAEEAKKALDATHAVLRRSSNCKELEQACDMLSKAGATVFIRQAPQAKESGSEYDLTISSDEPVYETVAPNIPGLGHGTDPLDQISDLFRDLTEHRVHKQVAISLKDASIPHLAVPNAANEPPLNLPIPWKRPKYEPEKPWWRQLVTTPEVVFSVGFSLFLVFLTSVFYR